MFLIMVIVAVASLGVGHLHYNPLQILHGLIDPESLGRVGHEVIYNIRMPRILASLLAGGALAMAGASLQSVFHNPLVDPHIIGVTSGAAFGGTLALLLGLGGFGLMTLAFGFGLGSLVLVYGLARLMGTQTRLMLVLAGVILAGFFSALVSMVQYLSDNEEVLPQIVFWLMGSFSAMTWHKVGVMAAFIGGAGMLLYFLRWRLNLLSLGDTEAKSLGVNVIKLRWLFLILAALLTSTQVASSGAIGWIGLVVPHIARQLVGHDNRRLLPMSALLGATIMVVVDDLARTMLSGEIPIGIITALIGAPLFAFILFKNRKGLA